MRLYELFDKVAKWRWAERDSDYQTADIPSLDVSVLFEKEDEDHRLPINTIGDLWSVEFNRQGEYAPTGKGDEFLIFSTIIAILREFNNNIQPSNIYFTSRIGSRSKLYERMVVKFAEANGFDYEIVDVSINKQSLFLLTRKNNETL
jgi:hypothetical protein